MEELWGRTRSRTLATKTLLGTGEVYQRNYQAGSVCGLGTPTLNNAIKYYSPEATQTTMDWEADNFHARIKQGEILNHPYRTITEITDSVPPTSYYHLWRTEVQTNCSGSMTGYKTWSAGAEQQGVYVPPSVAWYPGSVASRRNDVMSLAVTKANANIDTSSMLALAAAAESRKTIQSLSSLCWRAIKIFKAVRRFDVKALKNEISQKELADRYMEARYAIRPLMYDVKGVLHSLSVKRERVRRTFRGYASDSQTYEDTVDATFAWYSTATWKRQLQYDVSARAGVLCDVDVSNVNIYGMDQLLETAWELTPFSFIVDWFVNVGDVIAAWTPNAGVHQRASWVTLKETLTYTNEVVDLRSTAPAPYSYTQISASPMPRMEKKTLCLERIVNPPLTIIPSINLRLNNLKLIDLGIIMRNIFR